MADPAFANPTQPNLPDFLIFLRTWGFTDAVLPDSSAWPGYALTQGIALTINPPAACIPGIMYTLAVYNCATCILIQIAPDQPGQTFFEDLRSKMNLLTPQNGLVTAGSDQGTSSTMAVPDWVKTLTIGDLQTYQSPWGRAYMAYAQSYGSTIWGLT